MRHSRRLIEQVAFWHGVPVLSITSYSRLRRIDVARHDAMAAVATNCRIAGRRPSLTDIGRIFGRHHATILAALRKSGVRD